MPINKIIRSAKINSNKSCSSVDLFDLEKELVVAGVQAEAVQARTSARTQLLNEDAR